MIRFALAVLATLACLITGSVPAEGAVLRQAPDVRSDMSGHALPEVAPPARGSASDFGRPHDNPAADDPMPEDPAPGSMIPDISSYGRLGAADPSFDYPDLYEPATTGLRSAGPGAADPGVGAGSGAGSAGPGAGSGAGSAGPGSGAASGAGSGADDPFAIDPGLTDPSSPANPADGDAYPDGRPHLVPPATGATPPHGATPPATGATPPRGATPPHGAATPPPGTASPRGAVPPRSATPPRGTVTPLTRDPRALGAHVFQGEAFDACTAPDLDTMDAWRQSPYGAVGVYIGGRARSCSQPRLNRSWVKKVSAMGWRILPVYVGSQSPCVTNERQRMFPIDDDNPASQGAYEAADAVKKAAALGIARKSPIYLDMEAYDTDSDDCTDPVITFTQSWSRNLRAKGYLPGFYSSAESGIREIESARADGEPDMPDLIWFARWDVDADVYGEPELPGNVWRPYRRIHQYLGENEETYGGYTLDIDRDLVDAPVAIIS